MTRSKHLKQPKVINEREAARRIGMSVSFLRQSRAHGDLAGRTPGPPFLKIGAAVRYLIDDLDKWILAHRIEPGGRPDRLETS